jgi:hypothetical protein
VSESLYNVALAAEIEGVFALPGTNLEDEMRSGNRVLLNDSAELGRPSRPADIRPEMLAYYQNLLPVSDEEAARRDQWIEFAKGGLTVSDVVNFRIYRELSTPCLSYVKYPLGTTYSAITRDAGRLEFRGPGEHQAGWYDAPRVSEARMSPSPEAQFRGHRAAILRRIGDIATQEGCLAFMSP